MPSNETEVTREVVPEVTREVVPEVTREVAAPSTASQASVKPKTEQLPHGATIETH